MLKEITLDVNSTEYAAIDAKTVKQGDTGPSYKVVVTGIANTIMESVISGGSVITYSGKYQIFDTEDTAVTAATTITSEMDGAFIVGITPASSEILPTGSYKAVFEVSLVVDAEVIMRREISWQLIINESLIA